MALDFDQLRDSYRFLKKMYNDINNENIENYSNQLYRIESHLTILKKFINSSEETEFKDDSITLYNNYKVLLKKFYYYIQHKEDEVLRNAVDACNRVVFK